jgi:hypothetical protein
MMNMTFLCFVFDLLYIIIYIYISVANKWKTGEAPPILGIQNSLSPGQKGDEGSGPGSQEKFERAVVVTLW